MAESEVNPENQKSGHEPRLVTITEFANALEVDRKSVYSALKRGRIKAVEVGGKKRIDFEKGKKDWWANRNEHKAAKNPSGVNQFTKGSGAPEKPKRYETPKYDDDGEMTHAEADRREKVFKAKLAEIKFQEQSGNLIEVAKVKKRAFELGRKTRDAVMQVPIRFSHEIAVETDPHKVEYILKKKLQDALDQLWEGMDDETETRKS